MGREMPAPEQALSVPDAVALIVGMVVGAGIFKTPSLVAANSGSENGAAVISMLAGLSLFALHRKEPDASRPVNIPYYPVIPLLFCAFSVHMLWSSFVHTGAGALVSACVLLAGAPLLYIARRKKNEEGCLHTPERRE